MSSWWEYVQKVAAGENQTQVATRLGLSQGGVSAWRTKTPKPESVAHFARTYNRPVLEAFVAAGFLTDDEAGITHAPPLLTDVPARELLEELGRRLDVH